MTRMRPYEVSNAYRPAGGVSEMCNRKKYRERRASSSTRSAALARVRVNPGACPHFGEDGYGLVCDGVSAVAECV